MSEEEYELLPEGDGLDAERGPIRRRPAQLTGPLRKVRHRIRRNPNTALCISLCFVVLATAFLAYDLVYLKAKLALAGSYNAFLTRLWPVGMPERTDVWENENSKAMHALITCMSENNCKENQQSIVLLSSFHFAGSISGHVSGEDIWATSVLDAVRELGYTAIFSTSNDEMASTYRQYPDLVKIIILEGTAAQNCFMDPKCIKGPDHPLGIPAWKMFSFHFWGGSANPLGNAWTLSPENYGLISPGNSRDNIYLGYSIERVCMQIPVTPIEDRPRQAYVLAKQTRYFTDEKYAWPGLSYSPPVVDVELVAGIASHNEGSDLPAGITDLGRLNKTTFYHHLGNSRVLVGIGLPFLSPSPYDALCMGVPFINPVMNWDKKNPENRTQWATQHDGLKFQDPPYVYNVKKGDIDGFWEAMRSALETPIERYIVPAMTMDALKRRVYALIEGDWRQKAALLLEERKKAPGKTGGALFEL